MKVLFVTREYPPFEVGGIAVHTYHLVKNLTELGITCKVLSFGDKKLSSDEVLFVNPSSSILERNNSSVSSNSRIPLDILRFSKVANRLIEKEDFDLIHVEEPYVGPFIKGVQTPKVTTFHSTSFGEIKAIFRSLLNSFNPKRLMFYSSIGTFFELMSIASSRVLIVPTFQVKNELTWFYRTPSEKIEIIENGVTFPDSNKISKKSTVKKKLGLNSNTFLVLSVARIVARKRLEDLIKAAKILQQSESCAFHVAIIGDGPDRVQLQRLVRKYDLEEIIELPGWISDEQKNLYFQAADVFVLTSEYEGFPLTLLEAMSFGIPIIASNMRCLNELRDGFDGLIFPVGDVNKLSLCLKEIIQYPYLSSKLSESARTFASNHDWSATARCTKNLYEKFLLIKTKLNYSAHPDSNDSFKSTAKQTEELYENIV